MKQTALHWLARALVVAAALTGCAEETSLGPDHRLASPASPAAAPDVVIDLGSCDNLTVPEGNKLAFRAYASGVQIYRWDGGNWVPVAPRADLFASTAGTGRIGTHFGGPTWRSLSGSEVRGAVRERCTPNTGAVQWLLLDGVSSQGPGIFDGVTFIQRINTVGGLPSAPGTAVNEITEVPYSTEYIFYQAR
jgi:hypothetical protein